MSLYVLSDAPIGDVVNLLLQESYTENTIAYNDNPKANSGEFAAEAIGISLPTPVEWPTSANATAHGFFYPPSSASHTGPDDELPPLIVNVHGGPTAAAQPGYDSYLSFEKLFQFLPHFSLKYPRCNCLYF